jgi:Secretory lipase
MMSRSRFAGTRMLAAIVLGYAALAATATVSSAGAAPAASKPVLPSKDPFYRWSKPLGAVAPGTVLRRRTVTLAPAIDGVTTATQVLYRTTSQLGAPIATVATIIRPASAATGRIVAYQSFYDGLGAQCDPSFTLTGGGASDSTEAAIIGSYVGQGDTVVVSDYEGQNNAFGAGQQSGYGTLDGIRATERVVRARASTPVAMIGYSGGSIATQFAAELAPKYAPKLRIKGVAAGGVPVDLAHNLRYTNGSKVWASATPGVLLGVTRAYKINLGPYASAYGRKVFRQVQAKCLGQYLGKYPGLRVAQLFKPGFKDYLRVPAFATLINRLTMGNSGTPREPMFLGVGNADGTGDGVMVAKDVAGLANEYCGRGVNVTFHEYKGKDHEAAAVPFFTEAMPFLQARLAGRPVPGTPCGKVGRGNSLAPLPLPSYKLTLGTNYKHGAAATLRSKGGSVAQAILRLTRTSRPGRVLQTLTVKRVSARPTNFNLKFPGPGNYAMTVSQAGVRLWRVTITVHPPS